MKRVEVCADLEAASEAASARIREAIRGALAGGILEQAIPVERILWLFGDARLA